MRKGVLALWMVFAASAIGCSPVVVDPGSSAPQPSVPATSAATQPATPTPATPTPAAPKPVPVPPTVAEGLPKLSSASAAYARGLGGKSHEGETLYVVIGASENSEAAATGKLKAAGPSFGDMQSYLIVEHSDHFEGMRPGYWVLVEAFRTQASAQQNISLTQRSFPDAYVKRVVVRCDDPIPVYDDLVPQ